METFGRTHRRGPLKDWMLACGPQGRCLSSQLGSLRGLRWALHGVLAVGANASGVMAALASVEGAPTLLLVGLLVLWSLVFLRLGRQLETWFTQAAIGLRWVGWAGPLGLCCLLCASTLLGPELRTPGALLLLVLAHCTLGFAILGDLPADIQGSGWGLLPWACGFLAMLPGAWLLGVWTGEPSASTVVATALVPSTTTALLLLAIWPSTAERELRRIVASRPELQMLTGGLEAKVTFHLACSVPYGLGQTGVGARLGDPVLGTIPGLRAASPVEARALLARDRGAVMSLLHRFPDARLEPDAVVFTARLSKLQELAGQNGLESTLDEGLAAAHALVNLLESDVPDRPHPG